MEEHYEVMFAEVSKSELRQLLREQDLMHTDAMTKQELIEILIGQTEEGSDVLVKLKEVHREYVYENWEFLKDALPCDGDCLKHSTEMLLTCLVQSGRDTLFFKE